MNVIGTADRLTALCADVFERLGSVPEEARRVAVSLVDANLAGHDSHGVNRAAVHRMGPLGRYLTQPEPQTGGRYAGPCCC